MTPKILPIWLLVLAVGCRSTEKGPAPDLTSKGRQLYEAGEYGQAEPYLRGVLKYHPDSPQAEEALFLLAECQRKLGEGQDAFSSYKEFVQKYPVSRFAVGVARGEYDLGIAYLDGKVGGFLFFGASRGAGLEILEHMQIHFRNSSLADDALARAADFRMKEKEYEEAADTYRRLLEAYPESEFQLRARFQLARAYWLESEGPDYDEEILEKSERAFRDFIGAVDRVGPTGPQTYATQVQAARQMIARIRSALAEKQIRIAQFYERTHSPQSAILYYRFCAQQYPDTKEAARAQERLRALVPERAAQPGKPVQDRGKAAG